MIFQAIACSQLFTLTFCTSSHANHQNHTRASRFIQEKSHSPYNCLQVLHDPIPQYLWFSLVPPSCSLCLSHTISYLFLKLTRNDFVSGVLPLILLTWVFHSQMLVMNDFLTSVRPLLKCYLLSQLFHVLCFYNLKSQFSTSYSFMFYFCSLASTKIKFFTLCFFFSSQ